VRTNPKPGSVSSQVPRRGTTRSKPQSEKKTTSEPEAIFAEKASDVREEIAKLAYLLWEERGGIGGSPEEDWLRAEQEVLARSKA